MLIAPHTQFAVFARVLAALAIFTALYGIDEQPSSSLASLFKLVAEAGRGAKPAKLGREEAADGGRASQSAARCLAINGCEDGDRSA